MLSSHLIIRAIKYNYCYLQIMLAVGLLFVCSQITIPIQPVPITMQTIAVLFIGLFFSRSNACISLLTYLSLGAAGLPVFANFKSGIMFFAGPTAGYLVGFLLAVYVMTSLKSKISQNLVIEQFILCILGNLVIMGLGWFWLSRFLGDEIKAFELGVKPFIIPGVVKSLILVGIVRVVNLKRKNFNL